MASRQGCRRPPGRGLNAQVREHAFQVLLRRLLAVETDPVELAIVFYGHDPARGFKIMFRLADPLAKRLNDLRRHVHRGFFPHATPANIRCLRHCDTARIVNWSIQ